MEFQRFPKIPRLNKPVVITEKIDGTNGAVIIEPISDGFSIPIVSELVAGGTLSVVSLSGGTYAVYAQSRKRVITRDDDNFGFASWVTSNAEGLVRTLGPGRHFGEWWGHGIQRGYGLPRGERRFSLFNTHRWHMHADVTSVPGLRVVPLVEHTEGFNSALTRAVLRDLKAAGSYAAPGFMNPEGVVLYHSASNQLYKAFVENDSTPKAVAEAKEATREAMEKRAEYA